MKIRGTGWLLLALLPGLALGAAAGKKSAGEVGGSSRSLIAVEGPSWIRHLDMPLDETSLGRVGEWGPAAGSKSKDQGSWGHSSSVEQPNKPFALTGADLYRLLCQSCHRPNGTGVPPEIRSILGPVQATSAPFLRRQMTDRGLSVDPAMIRQLSSQAQTGLHDRLQKGGEKMPPFSFLEPLEEEVLVAYLKDLAGVPVPGNTPRVVLEPPARSGELLVKGTCHVCHDAASSNPGGLLLTEEDRAIPTLATIGSQRTTEQVIRKVREGAIDPAATLKRGRMPLFTYLTPEEIGAAYNFILGYPPQR